MATIKSLKARNENFGKTIFDPNTFQHFFVSQEEYQTLQAQQDIHLLDNEVISTSGILQAPIRVYLDMTLACNLACVTCVNRSGSSLDDELTDEEIIHTLIGLKEESIFDIRFTGGEIITRRGWYRILSKAKELDFTFSMNTNGNYKTRTIDQIIEVHPDEISVSLDGNEKLNDTLRGQGSYKKALTTIVALSKQECRVTINTTVTPHFSEEDARGLLEIANRYCHDISFFHVRPIGRASEMTTPFLSYEAIHKIMGKIEELKREYPMATVRTRSSSLKNNAIQEQDAKRFGLMDGGTDGFTRFNIMSNGDLYAGGCTPYVDEQIRHEILLGNIREEDFSIRRVWHTNPILQKIREWSIALKQTCNACPEYGTRCHGFTLEMELYRKKHGINPYCVK